MQKYSNTKGQKYLDCMQRVHVFCLKLHGVSIKGLELQRRLVGNHRDLFENDHSSFYMENI